MMGDRIMNGEKRGSSLQGMRVAGGLKEERRTI